MISLIGHAARWSALARSFAKGQIPQTLLVSGPPHIGKWTLARRYAQLLLCPQPIEENGLPAPCAQCRVCHQVEIETFPDFKVYRPLISAAEKEQTVAPKLLIGSVITIDAARDFGSEAMMKPLAGKRKVMVVLQADRMTEQAQNCLLKTFEEPIPGLSIFLVCDNADYLKATIRSRCWHLPLGLVRDEETTTWLRASIPNASEERIAAAVEAASGRPGAAWRELQRLTMKTQEDGSNGQNGTTPRATQAQAFAARITRSRPVGALALTEEALRLAKEWWDEDQKVERALKSKSASSVTETKSEKKADAKITRTSAARFLDELARVYRMRWQQSVARGESAASHWSDGLDQIRKTRHYILQNANASLALDVLFGRLIAGHVN